MGVAEAQDTAAVAQRGELDLGPWWQRRAIEHRRPIGAQARDAAVGEDRQAQPADRGRIRDRHDVARAGAEGGGGHQWAPFGRLVVAHAALDRGAGRVVAGEEARIDVDDGERAGEAEADHAPVVADAAAPARLPAVHPLAVRVVLVGEEDRLCILDQPLLGAEELVRGSVHRRAQARRGEVHQPRERGLRRIGHGALSCDSSCA